METALLIRGLACLMAVCGLWLLQAAWRLRTANGWRLAGGWSAITLSVICWAATSHPDKGSALGIVVIMIAAMAALSWIYVKADRKTAREAAARVTEPAPASPLVCPVCFPSRQSFRNARAAVAADAILNRKNGRPGQRFDVQPIKRKFRTLFAWKVAFYENKTT